MAVRDSGATTQRQPMAPAAVMAQAVPAVPVGAVILVAAVILAGAARGTAAAEAATRAIRGHPGMVAATSTGRTSSRRAAAAGVAVG
jgi:hypothetical protein